MQIGYFSITVGVQFFLLVGYLLYALFRKYPAPEDGISLMSWVGGLIGIITLVQIGLLVIVSSVISLSDRFLILLLVFVDLLGLPLMAYDTLKRREQIRSESSNNSE